MLVRNKFAVLRACQVCFVLIFAALLPVSRAFSQGNVYTVVLEEVGIGWENDVEVDIWNSHVDIWVEGQLEQKFFNFSSGKDFGRLIIVCGSAMSNVHIRGNSPNPIDVVVHGGDENDFMINESNRPCHFYGGSEFDNDILIGGSANDSLFGGPGNDIMIGGGGNDEMDGGDGDDLMWGGPGEDLIIGGLGVDYVNGEAGDDALVGQQWRVEGELAWPDFATDTMVGGPGSDVFGGAICYFHFVVEDVLVPVSFDIMQDYDKVQDRREDFFYSINDWWWK